MATDRFLIWIKLSDRLQIVPAYWVWSLLISYHYLGKTQRVVPVKWGFCHAH